MTAVKAPVPGVAQPAVPPVLPEPVVEALVTIAGKVQDAWDAGRQQGCDVPTWEALGPVICGSWNTWTVHETAKALRSATRLCSWDVDHHLGLLACSVARRSDRECGDHSLNCGMWGSHADPAGCCLPAACGLVEENAGRLLVVVAGLLGRDVTVLAVELAGRAL